MPLSDSNPWRGRLLLLRGVLVALLGLAATVAAVKGFAPLPALQILLWLAAMWLPSLWYWPTRHKNKASQQKLLHLELVTDSLLFLALMYHLGGAANPLIFYLLIPTLMAALSASASVATLVTAISVTGYGLLLYWHAQPGQHSGLQAITHDMHSLHGEAMWITFSVIAAMLALLGQALQRARRRDQQQQAVSLSLGLQRERMYQLAGELADRAHELNTPLSTLLLLLEEIAEQHSDDAALVAPLEQCRGLAMRMANTLKQDAGAIEAPQQQRLSQISGELGNTLRLLAPTLEIRFIDGGDPLLAPASAWQRVLLNLGYNAIDAGASAMHIQARQMPTGWVLQISDNGPRHQDSERQGLGVGLALVETTLATLAAQVEYRFDRQWTQVLIDLPLTTADAQHDSAITDS